MHPPVGGSTIAGAFRWRTNSRLREYNSGGDKGGARTVDGTRKPTHRRAPDGREEASGDHRWTGQRKTGCGMKLGLVII